MGEYVGLDWAGTGWVGAVLRDGGDHTIDVFPTILNVWRHHAAADRILVDIPIGLAAAGKRPCDVRAKELLAPERHTSVFWPPVRSALSTKTLTAAKAETEPHGFSLSNQAWAIVPRIRELEAFFAHVPEAADTVRESHPEVCFAAFNDGEPLAHAKSTAEGLEDRRAHLADQNPDLSALFDEAVATFIDPPAHARRLHADARDDIVDALVLAETANRSAQRLGTLPADPPVDTGATPPRPMEIVYPSV